MKFEVGMYVRTKKGIAKYLGLGINILKDDGSNSYNHWKSRHIFDNYIFDEEYGDTLTTLDNIDEIIIGKPSYNIIDLIEVGDYVNGYKVFEVDRECCRITLNGGDIGNEFRLTYLRPTLGKNMGIKSIVTKEQFESMQYKVGE